MKSALWKDILREIRKSKGRFFSIMMIVAIGVAFFAGVKGSVPDMKYTADKYFDDYQAQDIQLVSSVGFTKEDVEEKYIRDFLNCSVIDRNSDAIKLDKVIFIYKYGSKMAKKIAMDEKLKMM